METKSFVTRSAIKVLGGIHFVGQTMSDLSLNAELKLLKPSDTEAVNAIVKHRQDRSYNVAVSLGLLPNPSSAIADMTQSEQ